jgi:hypothetical protein
MPQQKPIKKLYTILKIIEIRTKKPANNKTEALKE